MNEARALFQRALALLGVGEVDAAEELFRQVEALVPGDPALLHKFGDIAWRRGDFARAEDYYRQAHERVPAAPGYRTILGHARLFRGDYAGGFPLFDSWRELPDGKVRAAPAMPIPAWTGEPLVGKRVLIWSEEGMGDQIMYARFVRDLERLGGEVVWVAQPELVRLFRDGLGVETFPIGLGSEVSGIVDYVIPSSRLPAVLMPALKTVPPAPYLKVAPATPPFGARIGIMAKGNPEHRNDARRSLDSASAERLLALPGAIDLSPASTGARDFLDTASAIAGLDLVIAVDTSVAHLAGALGKPVWILLPRVGLDWRWGREGDTTPWYASARLFRQRGPDWSATVEEVAAAVQAGV